MGGRERGEAERAAESVRRTRYVLTVRNCDLSRVLEEKVLPFVRRPGRYIGGETNTPAKLQAEVHLLLSYPDLYEVGMSNHALRLLFELVNRLPYAAAERTFAFWPDMAERAAAHGVPQYSLETFTPAGEFDIWGFSLAAELTYVNIPGMLAAAGVPLRAMDRSWPEHPLLLGGGPGAYNPEPLADFFDIFLIGDAEESLPELLAAYRDLRRESPDRRSLLRELAVRVGGLYVPELYRSGAEGKVTAREGIPAFVPKRVLADLSASRLSDPLVPLIEVIHDRAVVEVMRGCRRGCRFCQAGWAGRPVREKAPEVAVDEALTQIDATGCDEVALLSLSSGDYRPIERVLAGVSSRLAGRRVNISMPSLNAASLTDGIFARLARGRRSGLTLAPEVATERLRRAINKPLPPGAVAEAIRQAHRLGWRRLKLYYMMGLPGEKQEDILALADQLNSLAALGGQLSVTVSNFVPKPQTPLQWAPQAPPEVISKRAGLLRGRLRARNVRLKFRNPWMSLVEGAISRGGRRTGDLIEAAWRRGAGFDDWQEKFRREIWEEALAETGLTVAGICSSLGRPGSPTPWDHIGGGVPREILVREALRAEEACR